MVEQVRYITQNPTHAHTCLPAGPGEASKPLRCHVVVPTNNGLHECMVWGFCAELATLGLSPCEPEKQTKQQELVPRL